MQDLNGGLCNWRTRLSWYRTDGSIFYAKSAPLQSGCTWNIVTQGVKYPGGMTGPTGSVCIRLYENSDVRAKECFSVHK
jgi:hypothetical protein